MDGIYERFNIQRPADFTGHSLSVSDVVVLNNGSTVKAYYVDSIGFAELPEFFKERNMDLQKEMLLNEKFQEIEIFGKPGLFSNGRLLDEDVPEGLYRYDLRGSDYDPGQPVTVEKTVVVNHAASVLMAEKLDLGAEGRLELGEDGLNFTGAELTVREFMEEQQQKRNGLMQKKLEQEQPFVKRFYVVENRQAVPLEIKRFGNLDDAMSQYQALPSHYMKALGVEKNPDPLPGSLDILQCKNGIDTIVEDYAPKMLRMNPLFDAALYRSTPIHHTSDSYTKTRTTLFLLCTKSYIVWRKIGVWRSFCWKSIKRKSLKLLVASRSFRLCWLQIGNLLLNRLHRRELDW